MSSLDLETPAGAPAAFRIALAPGPPLRLAISEPGGAERVYPLARFDQGAFLDLFDALARDFALRRPLARQGPAAHAGPALLPVLTEPVSPQILYGYGDPCVVQVAPGAWRLLATSNDAPDAFPILASRDLKAWRLSGFVFPEGRAPDWALVGAGVGDFWAPELHRLGEAWIVCFAARQPDRSLAIGLARGPAPDGPFTPDPAPILTGGVIDPHVLVDAGGAPWLVWKRDDNGVWPRLLAELLRRRPGLVAELLTDATDRRTAVLTLTLWPWIARLEPMLQFFALQPFIEAAAADLQGFEARLDVATAVAAPEDQAVMREASAALRTRIYAQRLTHDARALLGEPAVILRNDLPWEGHLIEGVWITQERGRYYLLYAGNDFSTALYGVGTATASAPTGPYRKSSEVFLSSTRDWWGPGHPSVAAGPDGRRHIFLHAYRAGEVGYKAFRALLAAPIRFEHGHAWLETGRGATS